MRVLLIFVDGWGIGADDPVTNPMLVASMPTLRSLCGGSIPTRGNAPIYTERAILVSTDPTMGIEGTPQSGTGQTALLTGLNVAQRLGEHSGPYPNETLRELLALESIFIHLLARRCRVTFANAYPPFFFDRLARAKARRSAVSFAAGAAGVRYRDIDDLRAGRAVSPFVTNERWHAFDATVPIISPRQAGMNLGRLARDYDFTLFEYFLTDVAGHKGDLDAAIQVLRELDEILSGALDESDLTQTLMIVTSDHGNIEDTAIKGHTLNPVPTLLIGARREEAASQIHLFTDIAPAILAILNSSGKRITLA